MADFRFVATIQRWEGLAADTKPTLAAKDQGARALETDTEREYAWNGAAWVLCQSLAARIGEIADNPTANTLLARVKGLFTGIVLAAGSAIIGKVGIDQTAPGTTNRVDVGAALPAGTNAIGKVGHDITGIGHGVTVVTTAGTDVALAASTPCKMVIIQAQTDNTSTIAVGASGVDATVATGTGIVLYPGEVITLAADNLADIYIDSLVNGEGVRYTYLS